MGLFGMMARTAVVAGTATAVSGRVARRQQASSSRRRTRRPTRSEQQAAADEQAAAAVPAGTAAVPAGATAVPAGPAAGRRLAGEPNLADEIQRLSTLKDQGILSEDEFTAAKTKLLGL